MHLVTEPESTVQPRDIFGFASGAEEKLLLGWGMDKTPTLIFVDSKVPAVDGTVPLHESKLPQSRTCGPTILLPTVTYLDYNDFKDNMVTGIMGTPQILLV